MARIVSLSFALALVALSCAFAQNLDHVVSPVTSMLVQDKLQWTVRTMKNMPSTKFSGYVDGGYEQIGGSGKYTGTFSGYSKGKSSFVKFNNTAHGNLKAMGFDLKYKFGINGFSKIQGKSVNVGASYNSKITGTVHGKKMYGKCYGVVTAWVSPAGLWAKESGKFHYYVDGKAVVGKYTVKVTKGGLYMAVYGKYEKKPFFFKYAFSLNVLQMGLETNPMAMTKNYGKVTVKAGGKTFTQSFDMKPEDLQSGMGMLGFPTTSM